MAYSSFTLSQVQSQFGLKVDKGVFFRDVPPLIPRQRTIEAMAESAPFAATQGSEKVLLSTRSARSDSGHFEVDVRKIK